MTKPKTNRYLVVVEPAPRVPDPPNTITFSGAINGPPPIKIHRVEAATAKEAADKAGVAAGGTAHVTKLAHVSKFTRPRKAELQAA